MDLFLLCMLLNKKKKTSTFPVRSITFHFVGALGTTRNCLCSYHNKYCQKLSMVLKSDVLTFKWLPGNVIMRLSTWNIGHGAITGHFNTNTIFL